MFSHIQGSEILAHIQKPFSSLIKLWLSLIKLYFQSHIQISSYSKANGRLINLYYISTFESQI